MRLHHLVLTFAIAVFFSSCNNSKSEQSQESDASASTAQPLPPLPQKIRDSLFAYCDYVDMIFYESPISASQSEKNTVRSVVYFPSLDPATPNPGCKPTGRLSYMIEGQIACEADFYFTDACKYFLFIEDGQVVYGNTMTPNAINFFQNVIAKASQ